MMLNLHKKSDHVFIILMIISKMLSDIMIFNNSFAISHASTYFIFNNLRIYALWLIFIVIVLCMSNISLKNNFIKYFIDFYFILIFIPTFSYLTFLEEEYIFTVSIICYHTIVLLLISTIQIRSESNCDIVKISDILLLILTITSFLAILYYNYLLPGKLNLFNWSEIYEIRLINSTFAAQNLSSIFIIFLKNITSFLLPMLLYISLLKKKYCLIFVNILSLVIYFINIAEKASFFKIILIIIVYFIFKFAKNNLSYFVLVGYIFSNIISFAELYLLKTNLIFMVFIRRMIYVPINLNFLYYKSFFNNDKLYFKQGVFLFSKLWNTSFENSYIYKICNDWFNGLTFSPNNGMFGEAYSQIGLLGIFIFPIIIYIYIKQFANFLNILNDDGISFMFSIILLTSMSNIFILSFRIASMLLTILIFSIILTYFDCYTVTGFVCGYNSERCSKQ